MPSSARRGTRFKNEQPLDEEDILYQEPLDQDQFTDQFMFQDYGDPYGQDAYDEAAYGQDSFAYQPEYYPASAYSSEEYEEEYRSAGVFSFIRAHWVAYLVAVAIAVILGAGAAVAVGVLGSTPDNDTVTQSETEATPDDSEISSEAAAASEDVNATE